jgi:uncharacterized membrane protein
MFFSGSGARLFDAPPKSREVMNSKRRIAYWITTTLVAAELLLGGVWDLWRISYVQGIVDQLGYPAYLLTILGIFKIPGAVVLFAPRLPRLKEWAYAGALFTYIGAVVSHVVVRNGVADVAPPLVFGVMTLASWALRPPERRDFGSSVAFSRGPVVAYWLITGLLGIECLFGGIMGALQMPPFSNTIQHLGYPAYFMTILGTAYVLAGIALLVPRFPRLKEWAYAGLVFNYAGAAASHLAAGDGVAALVAPTLFLGLAFASWSLRPAERRNPKPSNGRRTAAGLAKTDFPTRTDHGNFAA